MTKNKSAEKIKKDVEILQADLNRLASDVSTTWENIVELGKAEAGAKKEKIEQELRSRFANLKDEIQNVREKGFKIFENPTETIQNAGKKIEQNPLLSVCIALGVGIVLGKIIEKISNSND